MVIPFCNAQTNIDHSFSLDCGVDNMTGRDDGDSKTVYPALLGGLFVNTVVHLSSRLIGADFAQTTFASIKTNLSSEWVWDNDSFLFNNPGHPYQGGLYHAAARANGFNFYEAIFFDNLGSLTWELFGETDIPSINDLIVTTFGGAAFGEMLHLLYLEISSSLAAIPVSPMDALNNAVFHKSPRRTHNLYYLSTMTGAGWISASKGIHQQFENEINGTEDAIYSINIGCEVIYGNPFTQNASIPYSQFEILLQAGGAFWPIWLDWTILSDGYLVSFNLMHTEVDTLSTGLSMHYDLIAGNNTNFASNALDWSLKWRHEGESTNMELKAHTGWTFFGSAQYYPNIVVADSTFETNKAENNYGTGFNFKFTFSVQNKKWGRITIGAFNYLIFIFPLNNDGNGDIDFFNMSYFEYAYPFTKQLSLTINNALYLKRGNLDTKSDVTEIADRIMLSVKWTFIDKATQ
jgi:hypothetical protein